MIREEEIGKAVVDSCIEIHTALGPGLFESVYEEILHDELSSKGFEVDRQSAIPIQFKGKTFSHGFRADLLVENKVLLELKSVEQSLPVHRKQVLTYLKLSGCKLGFLLNFGEPLMKYGITRIVHNLPEPP